MSGTHKHPPIPFRPTAGNRAWLLEEAGETKRAVNAILNEAVTAQRKAARERRKQQKEEAMPKQAEQEIIRAKWLFDGAATLAEAAAMLRAEADRLEQLGKEGWTLEQPIEDDYGFLIPPA